MGIWRWWFKKNSFWFLLLFLGISVAFTTIFGLYVNPLFFIYPIGLLVILTGSSVVSIIYKYIEKEKEEYKKTLK